MIKPVINIDELTDDEYMIYKFQVGERVKVSEAYWWAKGMHGVVASPPSEVTAISGAWRDNLVRVTMTKMGAKTAYWVWFDEPQRDADGDGPYRGAEIWEEFLTAAPIL